MIVVICGLLCWLLVRSTTAMTAALAACILFVRSVMPGLFPYMLLALMLTSRLPARLSGAMLIPVGWFGGSPPGARLLNLRPALPLPDRKRLAVTCATMSPMFLMGTVPQWTGSAWSGVCLFLSTVIGGAAAGWLAGHFSREDAVSLPAAASASPISLGQAVEAASGTMLLVCGTMMLLRVLAALAGELLAPWPQAGLIVMTLLEVTTGVEALAALPLPLPLRTALIAAATGFGGAAILLQNRAVYPSGLMTPGEQIGWQLIHGLISGLAALGLMLLFPV